MSDHEHLEDRPQSFVVRMWQEEQGRWRGKVKHVQSQEQRGFTRLAQLTEFVEQWLRLSARSEAGEPQRSSHVSPAPLRFLLGGRVQVAGLAAGLLALCVFALLAADPNNTQLSGAAVGGGSLGEAIALFIVGAVFGGLTVAALLRKRGAR